MFLGGKKKAKMYCNNDRCAELKPCPLHASIIYEEDLVEKWQWEYEVASYGAQLSGFINTIGQCDGAKHNAPCEHYRAHQMSRHAFVFRSPDMVFEKCPELFCEDLVCKLCTKLIVDENELVVNHEDGCDFHESCLDIYLHNHSHLEFCPGCDVSLCRACVFCSY